MQRIKKKFFSYKKRLKMQYKQGAKKVGFRGIAKYAVWTHNAYH